MVKNKPYFVAGVVSLVIFLIGFLLGFTMLDIQLEELKSEMDKNELELRNIQLELVFLDMLGNDTICPYLTERIRYIDKKAWELGNKIVNPEGINEKYFDILKRRYLVSLIEDWLFSKELAERCETNRMNVLYFFEMDSDICKSQGYVLDYLVENDEEENLHIFAIDKDMDEPVIQLIVKHYGISEAPAIVVSEEKYEGFRNKEELIEIFCGVNNQLSFCK